MGKRCLAAVLCAAGEFAVGDIAVFKPKRAVVAPLPDELDCSYVRSFADT